MNSDRFDRWWLDDGHVLSFEEDHTEHVAHAAWDAASAMQTTACYGLANEERDDLRGAYKDRARRLHYMTRMGARGHDGDWAMCQRTRCAEDRALLAQQPAEGAALFVSDEART